MYIWCSSLIISGAIHPPPSAPHPTSAANVTGTHQPVTAPYPGYPPTMMGTAPAHLPSSAHPMQPPPPTAYIQPPVLPPPPQGYAPNQSMYIIIMCWLICVFQIYNNYHCVYYVHVHIHRIVLVACFTPYLQSYNYHGVSECVTNRMYFHYSNSSPGTLSSAANATICRSIWRYVHVCAI